jgi:transposase
MRSGHRSSRCCRSRHGVTATQAASAWTIDGCSTHPVRAHDRHRLAAPAAQLGYGSGMTCWRRLRDWHTAGVWDRLHALLLSELRAAARLDWSQAIVDSSHIRALKGGERSGQARLTGVGQGASTTSSPTPPAFPWRSR